MARVRGALEAALLSYREKNSCLQLSTDTEELFPSYCEVFLLIKIH